MKKLKVDTGVALFGVRITRKPFCLGVFVGKHGMEIGVNRRGDIGSKSEAIVRKILDLANADKPITFEQDWGGNSLTVMISGQGHAHVGGIHDGATFEELVDSLYNSLHDGPGLSWVDDE